jgi:UDP-N-acetylglucosamine 2-epimerase
VKLVGTDEDRIVTEAAALLEDRPAYDRMARIKIPMATVMPAHASRNASTHSYRLAASSAGLAETSSCD